MKEMDYSKFVKKLFKTDIRLTEHTASLWHSATGISGEAGEILELIKKHVINGHPLDRVKVIKELGDIEFYLEAFRDEMGIGRDTAIRGNVRKLTNRYGEELSYSDQRSIDRADEEEDF